MGRRHQWGQRCDLQYKQLSGTTLGSIRTENSIIGSAADGGGNLNWHYDDVNSQLIVGRSSDNLVTLVYVQTARPVPLSVTKSGHGTVTSIPTGIDCGIAVVVSAKAEADARSLHRLTQR